LGGYFDLLELKVERNQRRGRQKSDQFCLFEWWEIHRVGINLHLDQIVLEHLFEITADGCLWMKQLKDAICGFVGETQRKTATQ